MKKLILTIMLLVVLFAGEKVYAQNKGNYYRGNDKTSQELDNYEHRINARAKAVVNVDGDGNFVNPPSSNNQVLTNTKLDSLIALADRNLKTLSKLKQITSGGNGQVTVNLVAVQLSADVECDLVEIMNNSENTILYYGWDNTVTTANGMGALEFGDVAEIKRSNLNQVWLISNTALTDVRYEWIKY